MSFKLENEEDKVFLFARNSCDLVKIDLFFVSKEIMIFDFGSINLFF